MTREIEASPSSEHECPLPIEDLLVMLEEPAAQGQAELGETIRNLVHLVSPGLENALRNSAHDWAHEPLAFLHFSAGQRDLGLDQALIGYQQAPFAWPEALTVRSGACGHVYLPRVGYVTTPFPDEWMTFRWKPAEAGPATVHTASGAIAQCRFSPAKFVPETKFELLQHPAAWMETAFEGQYNGSGLDIGTPPEYPDFLHRAWRLLRETWPVLARLLESVLRLIVIFREPALNSFATPAAHGAVFLNSALGDDEVFLLEDLVHQGGHVLFNSATLDATPIFQVEPSTPLKGFAGTGGDHRFVYVALHGIFTEALIAHCLDAVLSAGVFQGKQRHELEGRLAFILKKLAADRKLFQGRNILTPLGDRIVGSLSKAWEIIAARRLGLLRNTDMSNQAYNFDYPLYAALNPREATRGATTGVGACPTEEASRIGFGCYRASSSVPEHGRALKKALALGCTLIDTASSYMDGRSEQLVGEVLEAQPQARAVVITKLGYISPAAQQFLEGRGIPAGSLHALSPESKYSLAADALRAQFELSRRRLKRRRVDAVLLHNPEHLLEHQPREERISTLRAAFELFEGWVDEGILGCYGVSSNTLAQGGPETLGEYLRAASDVSSRHHFRIVQFPFNFLESAAAESREGRPSLIEQIRRAGLVSIGNRPLNALRNGETFRFAGYERELADLGPDEDAAVYERCVALIRERLQAVDAEHDVMEFHVMKFLRDNWSGIEHPDLVDEIFGRRLYPFVDCLWNSEAPAEVGAAVSKLHGLARLHAKRKLSERARVLRSELIALGLAPDENDRSLAELACEFGLRRGLDHVLVGMRSERYVEDFKGLLAAPEREEVVCR